jgi:hypothetical protein
MVQRTYGKQAENMDMVTKIFTRVLDRYEPELVIQAVKQWIMDSPEFPTPSDIKQILSPTKTYDKTIYIGLKDKNKSGGYLTEYEWEYINGYETSEINK